MLDSCRWLESEGYTVTYLPVQANGLMVLPHEQGDVALGDVVQLMMFDGVI